MAKNLDNQNEVIKKPVEVIVQKYSLEEFYENSKELFNVNSEVIKGATYDCELSEFTVDEMREQINKFLGKAVSK